MNTSEVKRRFLITCPLHDDISKIDASRYGGFIPGNLENFTSTVYNRDTDKVINTQILLGKNIDGNHVVVLSDGERTYSFEKSTDFSENDLTHLIKAARGEESIRDAVVEIGREAPVRYEEREDVELGPKRTYAYNYINRSTMEVEPLSTKIWMESSEAGTAFCSINGSHTEAEKMFKKINEHGISEDLLETAAREAFRRGGSVIINDLHETGKGIGFYHEPGKDTMVSMPTSACKVDVDEKQFCGMVGESLLDVSEKIAYFSPSVSREDFPKSLAKVDLDFSGLESNKTVEVSK